jgi:predicted nuclease of predicted toxin-antitoxin system
MAWQAIDTEIQETNRSRAPVFASVRFLIDADLGAHIAPALWKLGYDAIDALALKLKHQSDEDVFAAARRERRILLTRNRAFLDDHRFPVEGNPGICILPAANDALTKALANALSIVRNRGELYEGARIVVGGNGRFTICHHHHSCSGTTIHYKLRKDGPPLIWIPRKSRTIDHSADPPVG